jgi:hypothetical protein
MKMIRRDASTDSKGNPVKRSLTWAVMNLGGYGVLHYIEGVCRRRGMDTEKIKLHGVD